MRTNMVLHFDVRDLMKAPRLAFSFQRIGIQFTGLAVGYGGYLILTFLSLMLSGMSLEDATARFGFFPCLYGAEVETNVFSIMIFLIGSVFLLSSFFVTNTAVARATFMVLRGNDFYTWREGMSFGLRKSGSTLMTLVSLLVLILSLMIGAGFIGLLGRLPFVGELLISLLTLLWLFGALFLTFIILVLVVAVMLTPSIIATTNEDALEAIFQSFSTGWSQPWRLIVYNALNGVVSMGSLAIFAIVFKRAFVLMNELFSFSMGNKYINLASHAQYLLQSWTRVFGDWMHNLFGSFSKVFFFSRDFIPLELSATSTISAHIFALFMMVAAGLLISYLLATFNAGSVLTYLALRRLKDGENLLQRAEEWDSEKELEGDEDFSELANENSGPQETEKSADSQN